MYLQPFGPFRTGHEPPLDLFRRFAAAFFTLPAAMLPVTPVTGVTTRINRYTGKRQLLTRDLLTLLARQRPAGACCVIGITMDDLYPDPAWNFVFGQASPRERVGVYSFARYLPGEAGPAAASLLLQSPGPRNRPPARNRPLRVLFLPHERLGQPARKRRPAAPPVPC